MTNSQKTQRWWIAPVLAGTLGLGAALGATAVAWSAGGKSEAARSAANSSDTLRQLELFADVLASVKSDYVVPVKDDKLIAAAIDGMLQSLDPHSSLMTSDDFKDLQSATKGEYGGLGIEVTSEDGAVKVISPMDEGPAARAGIKSGDKLIAVDGVSILGLPLDEAVKKMRGPEGTSVDVTIAREGQEPFVAKLKREIIVLKPVTSKIEGDYGYIRISTFVNERTSEGLNKAIDDIQRKLGGRLKGIVLDLRNNGGGLLDQATEVADVFIDRGVLVQTRGRRPDDVDSRLATPGQRLEGVPMVVLINEGTASASEIVAGALQDRGRATIVGMGSFGKGSVQNIIPLRNGSDGALRLTTSKYYTPAGRSIQGAGIEPDIEISAVRITEEQLNERKALFRGEEDLPHALDNESGVKRKPPHMPAEMPPVGWKESEDYQLKRAYELLAAGLPKRAPAPATRRAEAKPAKGVGAPVSGAPISPN
ncbi:putative CtpA-like serine protease [Candidatus Phycosocius bacilliformis]|uniref:Putative CtpA-like serine protease n=1 Tax=Candidatus Phycosocius bacilliformis TaxID=1445552 RepID=A0A2P2EEF9_9PROT|nr:S41 family peptidase [Candidatus Phycosocius bacilliformis]GBF59446.1 putative CtpA-like serine protease [Candidatus Phycosocius bacilliformis]